MTRPAKYLLRMTLFLTCGGISIGLLVPTLTLAFLANPVLNGLIFLALLIGIIHSFRSTAMLRREITWIENFQREGLVKTSVVEPILLAPMASMLGERQEGRLSLSTMALRTLLDGIAVRLEEIRETSRYMIGLLVFLGLLGTFWGLLQTIGSVGEVIGGLSIRSENTESFFEDLRLGLKAPLAGMGTAFSSSLFGLAGSLILGFLALQVGQAHNRFYNELENWLSGQTRLGSGILGTEGDQSVPAFVQALLEQTADSLESLQRSLQKGEASRLEANKKIIEMGDALVSFGEIMKIERQTMLSVSEGQQKLVPVLEKLGDAQFTNISDDRSKVGLEYKNLETILTRIAADLESGRAETIGEIRSEIRLLARTLAALSKDEK